jgi:GH25 family lysozyme M1 (1,4-beta-N-acetylmuramidase)
MLASWVLDKAGVKCAGLPGAYCPTMLAVARERGACVPVSKAAKGDIVYFDWDGGAADHVGICIENHPAERWMLTIEGNTDEGVVREKRREYGTVEACVRPEYAKQAAKKPAAKKRLDGIDIASYQQTLAPSKMTTTDFIIVKATGGASYKNPCFRDHADATLGAGKLLGCYHFACEYGIALKPEQEADYFISAVLPYVGKATLWLDFEMDAVDEYSPAWCKKWLDRVKAKTGSTPGIYMSKSVCNSRDWSAVAKDYPLWVAQYPNYDETGYRDEPWTDSTGFGAWKAPTIFQYTSSGRIPGYNAHLDLDLFYGDKEAWMKLAKKAAPKPPAGYENGEYEVVISKVGIRERRSTKSKLCCMAAKGQRLELKDFRANKLGSVWAEIAAGDHKGRFVMVRNPKGVKRLERV